MPSLSILTFNVGLLSIKIYGTALIEPAPYVAERLINLPDALLQADPDIIALQEIYKIEDNKFLISRLMDRYPYFAYSRHKNIFRIQNGLLFLSKYPIQKSDFILFENGTIDEYFFACKGVLFVKLKESPLGELEIYNTHTTAGGAFYHPENKKVDRIRHKQLKQLLNLTKIGSGLAILVGDFNTGPNVSEENYLEIIQNGFVDCYQSFHKSNDELLEVTWDPKNPLNADGPHKTSPPQRIDHVFISKDMKENLIINEAIILFDSAFVEIRKDFKITLSDHYGLLVKISRRE